MQVICFSEIGDDDSGNIVCSVVISQSACRVTIAMRIARASAECILQRMTVLFCENGRSTISKRVASVTRCELVDLLFLGPAVRW